MFLKRVHGDWADVQRVFGFLVLSEFFKVKYVLEFLEFLFFFKLKKKNFQPKGIGESLLNFSWPQFSYYYSGN